MTEVMVVIAPTNVPYGKSFRRSFTFIPTAPAVAWKKLPCGNASKIVPPACSIAAADRAGIPACASVPENVCEAIVTPAVVDAVAPESNTLESGAIAKAGRWHAFRSDSMSALRPEFFTIPATAPVPMRRMETPITLESPNSQYSAVFLQRPQTNIETIPPAGSATSGSTAIPHTGRSARSATTTTGPAIAASRFGSSFLCSPSAAVASSRTAPALRRLASHVDRRMVTARAQNAGGR